MPLEKSVALRRAKTGGGRRAMTEREAKIIENPKSVLVMKGHATSQLIQEVLGDIHMLKKPLSKKLQRKNQVLPFEAGGETHLENLCRLSDCSMFAVGSHTKKRPHNLVVGRMHDFRILDMFELGVANYRGVFKKISSAPGTSPLVLFNGDDWDADATTSTLRSLLLDLFRPPSDIQRLNLGGVDRLICFTLSATSKVLLRHYEIALKRASGSNLPRPELQEVGPSFDLEVRRVRVAPEPMKRAAMKQARDPRVDRRVKNVSKNALGDKEGRIHVGKQDLSGLVLARMKGLGKREREANDDDDDEEETKEDLEVSGKKARVEAS